MFIKNKEQKDKENYLYIKSEIKNKMNRQLNDCKDNIQKMKEYMFEKTGYWDIFTFNDEETVKAFHATLKEYEKSLVKSNLEQFQQYSWYNYVLE